MAFITFQCYACNQMLKVGADKGGKKTKCIKCGTILTIPVAAAEPETLKPDVVAPEVLAPEVLAPEVLAPEVLSPEAIEEPRGTSGSQKSGRRSEFDFDDREGDRSRRGRDRYEDERNDDRSRGRRERDDDDLSRRRDDRYEDDDRGRRGSRYDGERDERSRDDRFRDDRSRSGDGSVKWDKVRLGMLITFIGLCVFAGFYGIEHIGVLILTIATFGTSPGTFDVAHVIMGIGVIGLPLALVAMTVGQVFWVFTSNRGGAMAFGIVCASLSGLAALFLVIFKTIPAFEGHGIFARGYYHPYGLLVFRPSVSILGERGYDWGTVILIMLINVMIATDFMMMGFYLRAQGANLRERGLHANGMGLVIFASIAAGLQLIWPFLMAIFLPSQSNPFPGKGTFIGSWILYWIPAGYMVFLLIISILRVKKGHNLTDR